MPFNCVVPECNRSTSKKHFISYHKLPAKVNVRKVWIQNLNLVEMLLTDKSKVCSLHFDEECINRTLNAVRLKDDAVPTMLKPGVKIKSPVERSMEDTNSIDFDSDDDLMASTSENNSIVGELKRQLMLKNRKVRCLQRNVRTNSKKIAVCTQMINTLRDKIDDYDEELWKEIDRCLEPEDFGEVSKEKESLDTSASEMIEVALKDCSVQWDHDYL